MQRELRPVVSKLMEVQQKLAGLAGRSPEVAMAAAVLGAVIESLRTGRDPQGQPTNLEEVVAALTLPAKAMESLGFADTVAQIVLVQRQILDLVEAAKPPAAPPPKAPAKAPPPPKPRPVQEGTRRGELARRVREVRDSLADRAGQSSDVASVMTILERLADALETGRAPNGNAVLVGDIPAGLKVPVVVLENQGMARQVAALQILQRDIADFAEQLRVAPPAAPGRPLRRQQRAPGEDTSTTEGVLGCLGTVVFATVGAFFLEVVGAQIIGFPEDVAWIAAVLLGLVVGLLVAVVAVSTVPGLFRQGRAASALAALLLVVVPWVGAGVWGVLRFVNPPAGGRTLAATRAGAASPGNASDPVVTATQPAPSQPPVTPESTAAAAPPTFPPEPTATVPPSTGSPVDEVTRRLAYGDLEGAVRVLETLTSTERRHEDSRRAAETVVAALRARGRRLTAVDSESTFARADFTVAEELERRFELDSPGPLDSGGQQDYPAGRPDLWQPLVGELVLIVPKLGEPYEARLLGVTATDLDLEVVSVVGGGEVRMARSSPISKVRSIRHPVLRTVEPTRTPTPRWGRG